MNSYKIFRQLEERQKRANPYKFYDKDELIDEILKLEDKIEKLQDQLQQKENIIKEVREYIDKIYDVMDYKDYPPYLDEVYYTLHPELKENK